MTELPVFSCSNDFSQMVAQEYLEHFNFSGMNIDQALRSALVPIPGPVLAQIVMRLNRKVNY